MKKSTAYFSILIITLAIVLIGYLVPVGSIKHFAHAAFHAAFNPWIAASAAACAFIFLNNKNYWLINIACAVIIAVAFVLIHKGGLGAFGSEQSRGFYLYCLYSKLYPSDYRQAVKIDHGT